MMVMVVISINSRKMVKLIKLTAISYDITLLSPNLCEKCMKILILRMMRKMVMTMKMTMMVTMTLAFSDIASLPPTPVEEKVAEYSDSLFYIYTSGTTGE